MSEPESTEEVEWISSRQAVKLIQSAGFDDPATLGVWAMLEVLCARATEAACDGEEDKLRIIPSAFWQAVVEGECIRSNWIAGIFTAVVDMSADDPRLGRRRWRFTGVEFSVSDIHRQIALPLAL